MNVNRNAETVRLSVPDHEALIPAIRGEQVRFLHDFRGISALNDQSFFQNMIAIIDRRLDGIAPLVCRVEEKNEAGGGLRILLNAQSK